MARVMLTQFPIPWYLACPEETQTKRSRAARKNQRGSVELFSRSEQHHIHIHDAVQYREFRSCLYFQMRDEKECYRKMRGHKEMRPSRSQTMAPSFFEVSLTASESRPYSERPQPSIQQILCATVEPVLQAIRTRPEFDHRSTIPRMHFRRSFPLPAYRRAPLRWLRALQFRQNHRMLFLHVVP